MERDRASRSHQGDGFVDDFLGLWHVHQDQTRRCNIERRSRQPGRATIAMDDSYVAEIPCADHRPSDLDVVQTPLHADHRPARTDARREQAETALWTAADLDNLCARAD